MDRSETALHLAKSAIEQGALTQVTRNSQGDDHHKKVAQAAAEVYREILKALS